MKVPVLGQIAALSFSMPVLIGASLYRKIGYQGRYFFYYCLIMAMSVCGEAVFTRMRFANSSLMKAVLVVQVISTVIVFCVLIKRRQLRKLALFLLMFFLTISAAHYLFTTTAEAFNEVDMFTSGIIYLLLGGILVQVATNVYELPYLKNPLFWIGSSILIYNAGTILIFTFANLLLKYGLKYFEIGWYVTWSLEIVSNGLFAYAFSCFRDE
jgi:hypothetical protein